MKTTIMTRAGEITAAEHTARARLANACPHRGRTVDTGRGCACPPTHVCTRDVRVVDVEDCLECVARPGAPS